MTYRTIRILSANDLRKVAILHQKAFRDSALTKLGLEPIRRYYVWQLNGPHDCFAVGVFDQEQSLLGFCFSGIFRNALSGYLARNRVFLIRWLLTHPWLILNPLVLDRVKLTFRIYKMKKQISPSPSPITNPNSFGILSIAVDPSIQGMGIGKVIMDAVEFEARQKGFPQMHLTVHPDNPSAVEFYERCGWERKMDSVSGLWEGAMIKLLNIDHENK